MKKKLLFLFALLFSVCSALCSCTAAYSTEKNEDDKEKLKIVTTVFPQYDFARAAARGAAEYVQIKMLLPPGSESHDYEPSLSDIADIAECDIFICVGGETDDWVENILELTGERMTVLRLIDMVELLDEEALPGMASYGHSHEEHEHDQSHAHSHERSDGEFDEHVWTTPRNAAHMTEIICDAMCDRVPELAEDFRACAEEYKSELLSLDKEYEELSLTAKSHTLIFADRFPFRYLAEEMSLDCYAAFSGCSSDSEPPLSAIGYLAVKSKEENASVIFTTEFGAVAVAELIAGECGAQVRVLHSCHNVSREDFERGVTCLDLMKNNLEVLREAMLCGN